MGGLIKPLIKERSLSDTNLKNHNWREIGNYPDNCGTSTADLLTIKILTKVVDFLRNSHLKKYLE
jgi:hypothetical protein